MKTLKFLTLLTLTFLVACTHTQKPDVSTHWTVSDSHQQIQQAQALEAQGVIKDLRITGANPEQLSATGPVNVLACLESAGKWLEKYKECEFMPVQSCKALGGEFNSCSSACRHNEDAMMCIQMCVPVCAFDIDK
ncbi:hypothetical protein [Parendozoicomonas sp. Alg238-R29]|uniref:hypothetical protein n=1 Tax=Parendozoicomonas sp. Alg238-R29 TaxID=2993446 RepID=UPI00248ED06A|nr:hypothetical protein [Parendozoicomonas sp. Alg238-R29]